jgi:hypothetical protein
MSEEAFDNDDDDDAEIQFPDELFELIKQHPANYLHVKKEYQSNRKICLTTLSAFVCHCVIDRRIFRIIVNLIFDHLPDFSDHKPAFLQFVKMDQTFPLDLYMEHFAEEIVEDREFVMEAIQNDGSAAFFERLPREQRMDLEILKLAMENVCDTSLRKFIEAVPKEALGEHKFILYHVMDRDVVPSAEHVPPSFWQSRDIIDKWMATKGDILISTIPKEFSNDRELCLAFYMGHSYSSPCRLNEIIKWIPKSFLADKDFVLQCLECDSLIFKYCEQAMQDDFDVFIAVAFKAIHRRTDGPFDDDDDEFFNKWGNGEFNRVIEHWGEFLASRVNTIRRRLEAHDEFMAFLACARKSRQLSILPLSTVDCDDETARGLNTMIARYLDFPGTGRVERIKDVWEEIVSLAVHGCQFSTKLMPLIPRQAIVQGVLRSIECCRHVSLQTYPEKLKPRVRQLGSK